MPANSQQAGNKVVFDILYTTDYTTENLLSFYHALFIFKFSMTGMLAGRGKGSAHRIQVVGSAHHHIHSTFVRKATAHTILHR